MSTRTGTRLGTVSRVSAAGAVYVELADVAPGFEFGPCLDTVGGLVKGDRIVVQGLARDADELVITGLVGGRSVADAVTPDELAAGLATRAEAVHQHHAGDVNDGVLALERLPVAPSGNANATQLVRADDARLSNSRTPTPHSHAAGDTTSGTFALARLPVAASGVSSATQLVRADDVRLRTAAGSVLMGGPTSTQAVAFPAGRFATAPIVTANLSTGANAVLGLHIHNVTTTGFTAYIYAVESTGIPSSWTAGAVTIFWVAQAAH